MMGFMMGALLLGGSPNMHRSSLGQAYMELYNDSLCKDERMINASSIILFKKSMSGNKVIFLTTNDHQ